MNKVTPKVIASIPDHEIEAFAQAARRVAKEQTRLAAEAQRVAAWAERSAKQRGKQK